MEKYVLIIKACGVPGEEEECANIENQVRLYGAYPRVVQPKNVQELLDVLNEGFKYDYIYLSAHGNDEGVCNDDSSFDLDWEDLADVFCETDCMKEECILILSCCRGGLNQVAFNLISSCDRVSYVVGPRQSLTPQQMLISYNVFLYNCLFLDMDPVVACNKIESALDLRFKVFDRLEVLGDAGYYMYVQSKKTAVVPPEVTALLQGPPTIEIID